MTDTLKALEAVEAALNVGARWIDGPGFDMTADGMQIDRALALLPTLRAALTQPAAVEDGELRRLMAEATPGPWVVHRTSKRAVEGGLPSEYTGFRRLVSDSYTGADDGGDEANAALIVAAVNALPGLMARALSAEEELSTWQSVFPDIAPDRVQPNRSKVEAELLAVTAERDRMKEALERFGQDALGWTVPPTDDERPWIARNPYSGMIEASFTFGDMKAAARAALGEQPNAAIDIMVAASPHAAEETGGE